MADIRDILKETLITWGLSPEKAAKYFKGVHPRQIRRWVDKKAHPQVEQNRIIVEGINKIKKEFFEEKGGKPGKIYKKDGKIIRERGKAVWTGRQIEPPKFAKNLHPKIEKFFNELQQRMTDQEKKLIFEDTDYWDGFDEICYLAKKYKVNFRI